MGKKEPTRWSVKGRGLEGEKGSGVYLGLEGVGGE